MKKLVEFLNYIYAGITVFRINFRSRKEFEFLDTVRATLYGSLTQNYLLYKDIHGEDYKRCFTDRDRWYVRQMNSEFNLIFDNKLINYRLFKKHVPMPIIYMTVSEGVGVGMNCVVTKETLKSLFVENSITNEVVIKPTEGAEGNDIHFLKLNDEKLFVDDGNFSLDKLMKKLKKGQWIFTQQVFNHEYSEKIFPTSVNTIRILTTVYESKVDVTYALHRFGAIEDIKVDNWSRGGLSAKVDVKTGTITSSIFTNEGEAIINHPTTDSKIAGITIPFWDEIKKNLLKHISYIQWLI